MKKALVAYFSATGTTARVAATLAEAVGGDLHEIKPETPYTKTDLDWMNPQSRSSAEMNDPSFRPAIADSGVDLAAYDVVFLGFPIWWYVAPTLVNTFLERGDFSGKIIVPFATSGSSRFGKAADKLRPSASEAAVWKEGKLLNGNPSKAAVKKWLETLDLQGARGAAPNAAD